MERVTYKQALALIKKELGDIKDLDKFGIEKIAEIYGMLIKEKVEIRKPCTVYKKWNGEIRMREGGL